MKRRTRRKKNKVEINLENFSLGRFTNFPIAIHGRVKVLCDDRLLKVQQSVIHAFRKLNGYRKAYSIDVSGRAGTYKGEARFEVGVADGVYFNYLNDEIIERLNAALIQGKLYPVLDFFVVVTYHYNLRGKITRLNFDYHQIRLVFYNNDFEIRLFHSKGIRRMPLDELMNQILDILNSEMSQQSLKPLVIEEIDIL